MNISFGLGTLQSNAAHVISFCSICDMLRQAFTWGQWRKRSKT